MKLFNRFFACPFGTHSPTHLHSFPTKHGLPRNYFKCEDCGELFTSRGANHEDVVPLRKVLDQIPQEHYDALYKGKLIGLHPPEPWSLPGDWTKPGTAFHGGPLPDDVKTVEDLQAHLPKAPEPKVTVERIGSHGIACTMTVGPDEEPPTTSQLMAQVNAVFAKLRNKRAEHEARGRFKDQIYGAIAETVALLGTCCRLQVGCVLLTKEGRVAGLGYNGAGPGMDHCHEDHCNETCRCIRTLHAEQNALYSRSGDPVVAYVTNEPCLNCTKELALAGVRRVVYLKPYTSIAEAERTARQEWIDHYNIAWEALNDASSPA